MKRGFTFFIMALVICVAITAQEKARLSVICNVPDAHVFVSGRDMGPLRPGMTVDLKSGDYIVKVSKPGYEDFETRVAVRGKGTTTLKVELKQQRFDPQAQQPNLQQRPEAQQQPNFQQQADSQPQQNAPTAEPQAIPGQNRAQDAPLPGPGSDRR